MPRDVSGNYTLPAGNPVVTGTLVSSVWANSTLSDLATAMTNSLDRTGTSAGMTGPFKAASGSVGAPGISFGLEPTTGFYRNAAGDIRFAVAGADVFQIKAGLVNFPDGAVGAPGIGFLSEPTTGFYRVGAGDVGFVLLGTKLLDIQAGQFSVVAPAASSAQVVIAGNGLSLGNGFILNVNTTPRAQFQFNGSIVGFISTGGAWNINAPTSGVGLTVLGAAATATVQITGNATSGQSRGLQITAGSTTGDYSLNVQNSGGSSTYFQITGDGETYVIAPSAGAAGPSGTFQIGYLDAPQNLQNAAYGLVMSDRGKHIYHSSGSAHTYTIPANASVAYPIGTTICIINDFAAGSVTLAITTDSLNWYPSGATGTRTLGPGAVATITKINTTKWVLSGVGIT